MTLARRMWLASAALALLVGAAFTALMAVSAWREATDREARSKDVTVASLRLEKLVSDIGSSFLNFGHGADSSLDPYQEATAKVRLAAARAGTACATTRRRASAHWRSRTRSASTSTSSSRP